MKKKDKAVRDLEATLKKIDMGKLFSKVRDRLNKLPKNKGVNRRT